MARVNPHRITIALDRAGLFGPTADAKLDAHEPDLDEWEAGRRQPRPEQLAKLSRMANVPETFFYLSDGESPRVSVLFLCARPRSKSTVVIALSEDPYGPAGQQALDVMAAETVPDGRL